MKLGALLRLRCPICGKGQLFQGYFDSPERCPSCGYFFMRESGYFLPHVVIGYGFTVIAALGSWPFARYVLGIRNAALTLSIMVAVAVLFGIWFVRYSKVLWLALDLTLHPPHSDDFESRGRD
jgi:uncharacterized protein (DUF983 family)